MAGFKALVAGAAVSGLLATYLAAEQASVAPVLLPGVCLASVTGGFLPDVDSPTGKPVRILFSLLALVAATAAISILPDLRQSAAHTLGWFLAIAFLVRYPAAGLFKKATVHRGAFHSLPAAGIAGLTTFLLADLGGAPRSVATTFGLAVGLGYLTHLILDEFWSLVDLSGGTVRPKKSLGSACKLRGSNGWTTAILYLGLGTLLLKAWLVIESGG